MRHRGGAANCARMADKCVGFSELMKSVGSPQPINKSRVAWLSAKGGFMSSASQISQIRVKRPFADDGGMTGDGRFKSFRLDEV